MADARTERLLNLVIALLAVRRPLTSAQIRARIQGYGHHPDTPAGQEAFERMLERDKQDLRELGVPLETAVVDAWTEEVGYRIPRDAYALPEVHLSAEEAAAVGLAMRFWRSGEVTAAVSSALRKLEAAGLEVEPPLPERLEPVADGSHPALLPLWRAVAQRRPVRFRYARPGAQTAVRTVEPWGVVARHGRWYVGGHDRDRRATRVFRVDRLEGEVSVLAGGFTAEVPADVDVAAMAAAAFPLEGDHAARLRVRSGAAGELRRSATSVEPAGADEDLLVVPYADLDRMAALVAAHARVARVEGPPELREAVVAVLQATRAALAGGSA